eukprot:scaffold1734_cov227-Pavlova_lutheri.AAC.2
MVRFVRCCARAYTPFLCWLGLGARAALDRAIVSRFTFSHVEFARASVCTFGACVPICFDRCLRLACVRLEVRVSRLCGDGCISLR